MKIRKAKRDDLKQIVRVYNDVFSEKPYNEKWNNKNLMPKILEILKNQRVYVAEINNKIIGFISFYDFIGSEGKIGCIFELGVDKKYRNREVGIILVKKAEEELKKSGCKMVLLDVNKKTPAIKFYKRIGYTNLDEYVKMMRILK